MLAYGELPHENVSFVGCHDNLTSFDAVRHRLKAEDPGRQDHKAIDAITPGPCLSQITEKAALTVTAAERARMAVLCLSLVALSQGVPFFHAGERRHDAS